MSVVISGALTDGAGIPMSGYHIILKSRVNTPEVVMHTVADVMTGNDDEYCFHARTGKYGVYLKQDWRNEYNVGDIAGKRLVRTVLIFTESSDQLSRATDRVPGLPASPGYVQ